MKRALSLVRWSLLAIAVLLPWATSNFTLLGFQPYPWTANMFELPKLLVLQACLTVAAVSWAVYLFDPEARVRGSRWYALCAAATVLVLFSALLSDAALLSFIGRDARYAGALLFVDMLVAAWLSTQALSTHKSRRELAWAFVASSAVLSAYALMQYAGLDPVQWGRGAFDTSRPSATFGNPIILGGFLVLPFALSIALALQDDAAVRKTAAWVSATLIALGTLVTFSRGAWLGALVAALVIAAACLRTGRRLAGIDRAWISGIAAILALGVLLSLGSGNANTNVAERVAGIAQSGGSAAARVTIWRTAAQSIADRPLLGAGPSTFRWEYASRATPEALALEGVDVYADDAHSYPLQLAVSVGLPAALLMLAFLVLVMGETGRVAFAKGADKPTLLLAGYWAGALGLAVHSLASVTTGYLVVLWISVGVLVSAKRDVRPRALVAYRVAGVGLAGVALVSLGLVAGNVRADALFMSAQMNADLGARIELLTAAAGRGGVQDTYPAALGYSQFNAAQEVLARDATTTGANGAELARTHLVEGASAYQAAIDRAPQEPENYYQLAWLYLVAASTDGFAQADEQAERVVEEGLLRAPNSPRLLALKGRILAMRGDTQGAVSAAERAYSISPGSVEVLTGLGEVRLDAGDVQGAREAVDEAARTAPQNPLVQSLRARLDTEAQ